MIFIDALHAIDHLRGVLRISHGFNKNPRSVMPKDHEIVNLLQAMLDSIQSEAPSKVLTLELDPEGKPIIPKELKDIFSTVPEDYKPEDKPSATVNRQNPILESSSLGRSQKTSATVLPRTTPHINRPPDLEDANATTVAK